MAVSYFWTGKTESYLEHDTILNQVFIFGRVRNLQAIISSLKKIRENYWDAFDTIYVSHGEYLVDKTLISIELECAELHLAGKIPATDPGAILWNHRISGRPGCMSGMEQRSLIIKMSEKIDY